MLLSSFVSSILNLQLFFCFNQRVKINIILIVSSCFVLNEVFWQHFKDCIWVDCRVDWSSGCITRCVWHEGKKGMKKVYSRVSNNGYIWRTDYHARYFNFKLPNSGIRNSKNYCYGTLVTSCALPGILTLAPHCLKALIEQHILVTRAHRLTNKTEHVYRNRFWSLMQSNLTWSVGSVLWRPVVREQWASGNIMTMRKYW